MSARNDILSRLRKAQREAALPAQWSRRRTFADLPGTFAAALAAVKGEVLHVASLAAAVDETVTLLDQLHARRIVVNDEVPIRDMDLPGRLPELNWHVVGQAEGDLRSFCAAADVGITGAQAALADTGSIVIASGPGQSRLASLLPPVHVALVATRQLLPDLFAWTDRRRGKLPANVVLVSGPSKTADIEQTMSVGVHGPKRFIVVLYEEG